MRHTPLTATAQGKAAPGKGGIAHHITRCWWLLIWFRHWMPHYVAFMKPEPHQEPTAVP
jgi:hypothetical protein